MPENHRCERHIRALLRLFLVAGVAAVASAADRAGWAQEDWPQFRGLAGQGTASVAADPPVRWGPAENVAWKTPIPGSGWSSPIVYRGRVYLTTALTAEDGRPTSLRAVCVDAASGHIAWNREVFEPDGAAPRHSKNSHASSTPIAGGDHLYVHFGHLGTACLTLDGDIVWRRNVDYPPVHGNGPSPVLSGDKLIFNCDGGEDPFVVALDRSTGEVAWRVPRQSDAAKKFSFSTPLAIRDGKRDLVVSPGSGAVCAYDAETGEEAWRVDYGEGYSVVPRPVLGEGVLYVSSGFDTPRVYAIRTGGQGDVTGTHVLWQTSRGAPKTPSMLLVGEKLYFVSDNGVVTCVDAMSGEPHWQQRVGGNVSASPAAAAGRIYITTENGRTVVLAAGTKFEKLAENDLQERTLASLAVVGDSLFIRTAEHLYRIAEP